MKRKNKIEFITNIFFYFCLFFVAISFVNKINAKVDTLSFKFKSPSFSGINTSSHYLTIENQENTRKQAVRDEIKAYQD